jgi:hypothetical protein
LREVFRLSQEAPDDIVLAVFSEHRPTLLLLLGAYYELAGDLGQVVALDYFLPPPGARAARAKPTRETPRDLRRFFDSPPDRLLGVVMQLQGDLFWARFGPEAGLHVFTVKNAENLCLVEARPLPFADYTPPADIDRLGTIKAKNVPQRRQYHAEAGSVEDATLGQRPWGGAGLQRLLRELSEERLNLAINAVTEGARA